MTIAVVDHRLHHGMRPSANSVESRRPDKRELWTDFKERWAWYLCVGLDRGRWRPRANGDHDGASQAPPPRIGAPHPCTGAEQLCAH